MHARREMKITIIIIIIFGEQKLDSFLTRIQPIGGKKTSRKG
jgi:hypothetical protein